MALWPFRRRLGRKRPRSRTPLSDSEGFALPEQATRSRSRAMDENPLQPRRTLKKQRTEPLPRRNSIRSRDGSYSPGRQERISVDRRHRGARVEGRQYVDPSMRPSANRSYERIGDDIVWTQVPTLHAKGNAQQLARRKSSKRRRDDHDREAEIKAMANFALMRTAAESWSTSRPLRMNSKRAKTSSALGRHPDSRSSDTSLPMARSVRSGMSSDSELGAFEISALDSLAPRPTLRYSSNPRWAPPNTHGPSRTVSQKRRLVDRSPIPEETIKAHKRIDDLADELDTSDLRELMERDKRRRERKKQRDQARAERQLARLAEKQKIAHQKAAAEGSPPPPNLERGVAGRELAGLGIETTSAVVTSSTPQPKDEPAEKVDQPLNKPRDEIDLEGQVHERPVKSTTQALDTTAAPKDAVPPAENDAPPPSPILGRFLRSKKSASASKFSYDPTQSRSTISPAPMGREESTTSSQPAGKRKARRSFSSFFKWAGKSSKRSSGPSSFSNTSREEMQAAIQGQRANSVTPEPAAQVATVPEAAVPNPTTRQLSGGVPKRTRSRFREDLPELPFSPPPPRLASREAKAIPENQTEEKEIVKDAQQITIDDDGVRSEPVADPSLPQGSGSGQESQGPSPQPHSISLASIDSEASWLSGRLGSKRSPRSRHRRHGRTSSRATSTSSSEGELGITEDEYLARLTPAQLTRTMSNSKNRHSAGEAIPSSDDDEPMLHEGDMKWGMSKARHQPTLTHVSRGDRHDSMKSQEGVLNSFDEENESEADDKVDSEVQRATSVNLGRKHARQISAGSAKLLEITPRQSTDDSRRRSSGPIFV